MAAKNTSIHRTLAGDRHGEGFGAAMLNHVATIEAAENTRSVP